MRVDDTVPTTFCTSPSEYGCHGNLSQLIRSTGRTQYLGSNKASGRIVSPHHVHLLTILRDRLSVGTQYLELMEVMIKY